MDYTERGIMSKQECIIMPREQMVLLMEKMMSYPEMEFELKRPQNIEVTESKEIEGKFYGIVKYSSPVCKHEIQAQ